MARQGNFPFQNMVFFGDDSREKPPQGGKVAFDQDLLDAWPDGKKIGTAEGSGNIQSDVAQCTITFKFGGTSLTASGPLRKHSSGKFGEGSLTIQGGGQFGGRHLSVTVVNPKRYSEGP